MAKCKTLAEQEYQFQIRKDEFLKKQTVYILIY